MYNCCKKKNCYLICSFYKWERNILTNFSKKSYIWQEVDQLAIRELKQIRRRRRGQRLVKNEFILYKRNSQLSRSVRHANGFKNALQLHMQRERFIPNGYAKNQPASSVHVSKTPQNLVISRFCFARFCFARAQLLLCSLNLLFGDVLVAVVVVPKATIYFFSIQTDIHTKTIGCVDCTLVSNVYDVYNSDPIGRRS